MTRKKLITAVLAACVAIGAGAQTTMVITTTDGNSTHYAIDNIQKITFGADALTVLPAGNLFNFDNIRKITFSNGTDAIGTTSGNAPIQVVCRNNELRVVGWESGKKAVATLYSVDGQRLWNANGWTGQPVSVASLPQGVYIFKINSTSFKFSK